MLQIKPLEKIPSKQFTEALKIYTQSFPPNELISPEILTTELQNKPDRIWIAEIDNQIIGMALIYPFKTCNLTLLGYLATDPNFRSQGIGTQLLNTLTSHYSHLLLEVEHPNYGTNQQQRQRRLNYYRRCGAKQLKNVQYILPALAGNTPTEMLLLILPPPAEKTLTGTLTKSLIKELYIDLYNQPENHPLLNQLLHQNLPETIEFI
ncbi:MAG TPA: GNAT family N-acetyltransferase [Halomicronema sp.]